MVKKYLLLFLILSLTTLVFIFQTPNFDNAVIYAKTSLHSAVSQIKISAIFQSESNITNSLKLLDALEVLSSRNKSRNVYYFIETSKTGLFKPRQICAVESTAKIHPNSDVYFLVVQPPGDINLDLNYALQLALRHYKNIQVLSLELTSLFNNSPLQEWYASGVLNKSSYPLHHTSDVIRIFIIWKFGGTYLDLDFVVKSSLNNLKNFLCPQPGDMANGALGFEINHKLTSLFVKEIATSFDPYSWVHNGPHLLLRVLNRYCGSANQQNKTIAEQPCGNYTILLTTTFYVINYPSWELFFDENCSLDVLKRTNISLAVHMWNKMSENAKIFIGSQQAYGLLAKEYCPRTYWSCDDVF